jgi:phage gp36-like protein
MAIVLQYAVRSDLASGINAAAIAGVPTATQDAAIDAASREMDSYFRGQFTLPFTQVGADVRQKTVDMAVFFIMKGRGYNPDAGADALIEDAYDKAIAWLKLVAQGTVVPDVTDSTTGSAEGRPGSRPTVISSPSRGFSSRGDPNGGGWPFQGG